MTEIRVRPMQAGDLDEIARIEAENFSIPWKREDFARYLKDEQAVFLVAEMIGETASAADISAASAGSVGAAGEIASSDEDVLESSDAKPAMPSEAHGLIAGYIGGLFAADEGDIANVSVRMDARRTGAGRALVKGIKKCAVNRGCRQIFLEVRASNEAAIGLYQQAGFEQIGIRKNYYDAPSEDALLMRLELSGFI